MLRSSIAVWCGVLLLVAGVAVARKPPEREQRDDNAVSVCSPSLLYNFQDYRRGELRREVPVWRMPQGSAFYFDAGIRLLTPTERRTPLQPARTQDWTTSKTLGNLANVGEPRARRKYGNPYVQGPNDPFPGYYVSCTSLHGSGQRRLSADPTKYVDASEDSLRVLPREVVPAKRNAHWRFCGRV